MDILDRLLGHDTWTTRQLLLRCDVLSEEQLDRTFEFGNRSLRETFHHIIAVMESHTDFLLTRMPSVHDYTDKSVEQLLLRLVRGSKDFSDVALRVQRENRMDELITNPRNGNRRSYGGIIAHLLTHSMHHRAQALYMMERLGLEDVIEGDALGWEAVARGWGWADGGSYGRMSEG